MDGQVEGKACGLVAMSTDVDISLLHKCFELGPYDCLVLKYQVGPGVPRRPSLLPPNRGTSHAVATRFSQLAPRDT
jgi:hypothetical protein